MSGDKSQDWRALFREEEHEEKKRKLKKRKKTSKHKDEHK